MPERKIPRGKGLDKPRGGFPIWVWGAGLLLAIGVGLYIRHRSASKAQSGTAASTAQDPNAAGQASGGGGAQLDTSGLQASLDGLASVLGAGGAAGGGGPTDAGPVASGPPATPSATGPDTPPPGWPTGDPYYQPPPGTFNDIVKMGPNPYSTTPTSSFGFGPTAPGGSLQYVTVNGVTYGLDPNGNPLPIGMGATGLPTTAPTASPNTSFGRTLAPASAPPQTPTVVEHPAISRLLPGGASPMRTGL
jgi:hypothetical protein